MASAVDCKGKEIAPASLLKSGAPVAFRSVHSPAVTAARRPYNTQAKEVSRYDDDDDDDDYSGRDLVIPSFFSQDVIDPLGAPTSMARLLSLMEDVASQTGGLSSTAGAGASRLGRWVAKEDDDAVYLKVPMPGLTKEHVEVRADKNILVIKGEGEKQPWDGDDDDSAVPKYNRRIEVPSADAYKMDKIKAEMKNGVLWVTLLKVKEEERKDVFHVKVE
ncbi:26.2 kDa heat shock protein, mitochondrial-like [Triticum dicoccoides]|uniref:23.9kDa heat-shock protein n=1 Tax=Triticum turgidum subsp. dicoccum TaxID=49225 RepID=A5A8U3_TRITU|nr:26.2 kDa heat shock protein, mitochondrial-like [Triticum dicoccoides]CAI96506.1 23.9kDa heat-shock protein [Triticum turgidum subsp. dicoccum]